MTVRSAVDEWFDDASDYEWQLAILLEYAYRGVAAQGGTCHVERDPGCATCTALTVVEDQLGWSQEVRDEERKWWEDK